MAPRKKAGAASKAKATRTDVMSEAIGTTLADDPELRAEVKGLVRALLADVRRTIQIGDPRDKNALIKIVIPDMLKRSVTDNTADEDLREEFKAVMKEVKGEK